MTATERKLLLAIGRALNALIASQPGHSVNLSNAFLALGDALRNAEDIV